MRVLIADDSKLFRDRLMMMFSSFSGVKIVGQAKDGRETIVFTKRLSPDIVILDIHMPGKSGIQILHDIKKKKPTPIVIMVTNYPYPQYRRRCMELGADFFFDKSSEFEKVIEVVLELNKSFSDQIGS